MPLSDSAPHRATLPAAVIAGTVALIESTGPLDDQAEVRWAHRAQSTRGAQFLERAWLLGERLGLQAELARWRHTGLVVVLALAALVALSALGTARAVVGDARTINAIAAFVTLLGLHFLTLLLWGLSFLWPGALTGLSLGKLALWLTARLPMERGPHSLSVLRATNRLLKSHKLLPWALGAVSHTIWALAFGLILLVLTFGFAFHAYKLSWETTILSADFFMRFVQQTGGLPSLLGFPVPDAAAVQRAGAGSLPALGESAAQREWAWWLMGCVFSYGLLPRIFLALLSYMRWRAGVRRMVQPDAADPYVREVFSRLDALDPPVVTDAEHAVTIHQEPGKIAAGVAIPATFAVIGFELPPEVPWPLQNVQSWPDNAEDRLVLTLRIAGSNAERQEVIAALERVRPWSSLVVCHAASSPDRGTARFLRDVACVVEQCSLMLVAGEDGKSAPEIASEKEEGFRRWANWLAAEHLDAIKLDRTCCEPDRENA